MIAKIMRSICFLTIFSINVFAAEEIPFLHGEYDPEKWPAANLRLSQAGTLKDVFDSGLRPYRFPGLEDSMIEVKHVRLVIHLASGKILPEIPTEWLNIKMFDDGELANIEGATPQISLDKSRFEMLKWLKFEERSQTELDVFLKVVKDDHLDFDDPYRGRSDGFGIGWKEPGWSKQGGGAHCGVGFRKTFSQEEPLRLYFSFSWESNRPLKDAKSYTIPIPPPPGYEHVSMKAPEKFGPDSGADINRSKGISIGESPEARRAYKKAKEEAATERPEKRQPASSNKSSDILTKEAASFPWWFIASFVATFVVAIAAWSKWRKSKSTP
jgi:hypothetical protein